MTAIKEGIVQKLQEGKRIDEEGAYALYDLELHTLAHYANALRKKRFSNKTYFNINRHINPTNVCADTCRFCAYSASRKNPNQYTLNHDEILSIAAEAVAKGAKEVHIVSAHHPEVGVKWYMEAFRLIKETFSSLHIKAMTAAEVEFLSRRYRLGIDEVLDLMIEHGVDSMPGGGAEIFDEGVREYLCKGKVSASMWLEIHKKWHRRGKMSNATMLFGHVESRAHRIDHMLRLRRLQDETKGFNAFIPLLYQRDNNFLKVGDPLTGVEILKTFAIARIVLDNIPHIKAYWPTTTVNVALLAQEYGADDLDGTIQKESIQSAAGAKSANGIELDELIALIKDSGFVPVERDSLYNELKVYG